MKETQETRLIKYLLENGRITSLEAIRKLGITRLSARIFNLKKRGFMFDCKPVIVKNRYGEKVRVTEYTLVGIAGLELYA